VTANAAVGEPPLVLDLDGGLVAAACAGYALLAALLAWATTRTVAR
jgi:hypothetical protein